MSLEWITPKTDWTKPTKFTYTDYNRIRNNLLYINDKLNEMYPDKAVSLDLGQPKAGYAERYYPSEFNAFENALESFTRVGENVNVGVKQTFKGNDPFIMADELNRIERCCIRWNDYDPVLHVTGIELQPSSTTVHVGEEIVLAVVVTPPDAEDKLNYTLTCDSPYITATKNGMTVVVKGKAVGTASVTVSINNVSATATINVEKAVVAQIIPSETNITLRRYESRYITVSFVPPESADEDYTVESSNIRVATYTKEDNFTLVIWGGEVEGTAVLTLRSGDASATINVTVNNSASNLKIVYRRGGKTLGGIGLFIGQSPRNIYIETDPADADDRYDYEYSLSDPVASITKNNDMLTLTGLSVGLATLTVTLRDLSCSCYIDVKYPPS